MRYAVLGRSGPEVSTVGIGTWQFGGEWGQQFSVQDVTRVLDRAADLELPTTSVSDRPVR